jgi:acyl dehydratase
MPAFEAIAIDDRYDFGSHVFTAEEIKRFASVYDPRRFHMDEEAAAKSRLGGLCASGWHTAAVMMKLMVRYFTAAAEAAAARGEPAPALGPSPGFDDLKWLKPVYAGDEITYAGRIVEKRETKSRPGWGIISMEVTGANQKGEPVFAYTGHVFVAMSAVEKT